MGGKKSETQKCWGRKKRNKFGKCTNNGMLPNLIHDEKKRDKPIYIINKWNCTDDELAPNNLLFYLLFLLIYNCSHIDLLVIIIGGRNVAILMKRRSIWMISFVLSCWFSSTKTKIRKPLVKFPLVKTISCLKFSIKFYCNYLKF